MEEENYTLFLMIQLNEKIIPLHIKTNLMVNFLILKTLFITMEATDIIDQKIFLFTLMNQHLIGKF